MTSLAPVGSAPARLLCLPHAGGRAAGYRRWSRALADLVDVCPIDLPGRYSRGDEPASEDPAEVVADLAAHARRFGDRPLALFGHSMGGWLAFEVARSLEDAGLPVSVVIVSASRGPADPVAAEPITDRALIARLRSSGTPPEILADPELSSGAIATLGLDLRLCRNYGGPTGRIQSPLVALAGSDDQVAPPASVARWSTMSANWRGMTTVPGEHFYPSTNEALVLRILRMSLLTADAFDFGAVSLPRW